MHASYTYFFLQNTHIYIYGSLNSLTRMILNFMLWFYIRYACVGKCYIEIEMTYTY